MTWPLALRIEPLPAQDVHSDFSDTFAVADPSAVDIGGQRGDGVFETIGVLDGRARDVAGHLERLTNSARALDLPAPHIAQWQAAIAWAEQACPAGEAAIRLVFGRAADGAIRALLTVSPVPDFTEARSQGIRVVTLDRGFDRGAGARAPWLLLGAKTLSYATHLAALREARRRGADDALFVTSDGYALEGATSSLVVRFGNRVLTPETGSDILPGTTQRRVLAYFSALGYEAAESAIPAAELLQADAVWLVSSLRLAVPVIAIDQTPLAVDPVLTADLNHALLAVA